MPISKAAKKNFFKKILKIHEESRIFIWLHENGGSSRVAFKVLKVKKDKASIGYIGNARDLFSDGKKIRELSYEDIMDISFEEDPIEVHVCSGDIGARDSDLYGHH